MKGSVRDYEKELCTSSEGEEGIRDGGNKRSDLPKMR